MGVLFFGTPYICIQLHILKSFFFRSAARAEVILENVDLQTNACHSKNDLVYLDSVSYMLFYINIAVEPFK